MNTMEIEKLLEKYYEGLTSLEEEKFLRNFFRGKSVPPDLLSAASQFQYYSKESAEEMNDLSFEKNFLEEVRSIPELNPVKNSNMFYYISGVAAGLLLLIGLVFSFRDSVRQDQQVAAKTVMDAEFAFSQTCDILALVSSNFNKGMEKVQCLGQFEKAIQKTSLLTKFYQYETLIINPDRFNGRP